MLRAFPGRYKANQYIQSRTILGATTGAHQCFSWRKPLPFAYQSTGVETRFTNGLDPSPGSRPVFSFHRPEHLQKLLEDAEEANRQVALHAGDRATFLARLQHMPQLNTEGLWPAQIQAITNLEQSLRENRPRALIQMATGSGKTVTAISFIYRLIKFAGAKRVLFLVDRGNPGDRTLKEFRQYASPYNNFKLTEENIVQDKGKYKEPTAPDEIGLPELSEGWMWARLDTLCSLKGGITVDAMREDPTSRTVPYLRLANVQRGYLDLSEVKEIDAPASDIEALRSRYGDILFNEGGDRDKLGRG